MKKEKILKILKSKLFIGVLCFAVGGSVIYSLQNNETEELEDNITISELQADVTESDSYDIEEVVEQQEESNEDIQGSNTDGVKEGVSAVISKKLRDEVTNTTLNSLQVNENFGTDATDDVIVLANLSWSTRNSEKMTREMLELHSNNLAVELARKLTDGSEITLFWKAEYTGLDIKHSYYVRGGKAYK